MKRSLALALATFLGLGLLSTSPSAARDAFGGVTRAAAPAPPATSKPYTR
jgi:hypothetical protein